MSKMCVGEVRSEQLNGYRFLGAKGDDLVSLGNEC